MKALEKLWKTGDKKNCINPAVTGSVRDDRFLCARAYLVNWSGQKGAPVHDSVPEEIRLQATFKGFTKKIKILA